MNHPILITPSGKTARAGGTIFDRQNARHFFRMYRDILNAPLKPSKFFMNKNDWDDIIKFSKDSE